MGAPFTKLHLIYSAFGRNGLRSRRLPRMTRRSLFDQRRWVKAPRWVTTGAACFHRFRLHTRQNLLREIPGACAKAAPLQTLGHTILSFLGRQRNI